MECSIFEPPFPLAKKMKGNLKPLFIHDESEKVVNVNRVIIDKGDAINLMHISMM